MPAETVADPLRSDLQRLFGHEDFRPGQREIVESTLAGRDTLAVLPTGGGKSLTYQLPAMLLPGATLVLSPLIALMKDQSENLPPDVAERTTIINSSLPVSEVGRRLSMVKSGRIKMIYAAPERLRQAPFLHALDRAGVSLVVIDEAHCISQWGHDFRPDYRAVGRSIGALNPRAVLAVTATATGPVQEDIERQIGRRMTRLVRPTFRDNLFLTCKKVAGEDEKLQTTLDICRESEGVGLVYAGAREKCEQLARMLKRYGVESGFYHAGLPPEERSAAQDRFMTGDVRVMVATVAFGMGVDKADIRFLIHYHPSRSLENYYQEAGRAGRDGKPSRCTLLCSTADASSARRHQREDAVGFEEIKGVYGAVRQLLERRRMAAIPFDSLVRASGGDENLVRAGLPLLEEAGLLTRHVDLPRSVSIAFDQEPNGEGEPPEGWNDFAAGARSGEYEPLALAQVTGTALSQLEQRLLRFQDAGLLTYRASPRDPLIELLPAPAEVKTRLQETLEKRRIAAEQRTHTMIDYTREARCRHGQIARYFGDHWPNLKCNQCDVCAPAARATVPQSAGVAAPEAKAAADKAAESALQLVHDLTEGYRPFALGKAGLARALRGTPDAPIKEGRSPAFGALASLRKADVERLIDTMLEQGYLRRDEEDEYRRLYLTTEGKSALRSGGAAEISWKRPTPSLAEATEALSDADQALLETLKNWRREMALAENVPAYVVFGDRALISLASLRPERQADLLDIPGIGPAKVEKYGDAVLALIAAG